jgi:hypothetical protein
MNVYDVCHVNGGVREIEADFLEREDDDWVFYVRSDEVYRIGWFDVLSIGKSTLRLPRIDEPTDERHVALWL